MFTMRKDKAETNHRRRKKKLNNFSVDVRSVFVKQPDILLEDAIDIAFFKAANDQVAWGFNVQ
jgi:hypothetical protein